MKKHCGFVFLILIISCALNNAQSEDKRNNNSKPVVYIWPNGTEGIDTAIPESVKPQGKRFYNIHNPGLTVFEPETSNGLAIIICAGGGYSYVAAEVEGGPVARILNESGITVFVLKYRLPNTPGVNYKHPASLLDALRAIQYVRYHAADYNIDRDRIGIIGFSAGGHLASMAGTLFNKYYTGSDKISEVSPRPDFMCLVYPVISTADSITHGGLISLVDSSDWVNTKTELSAEQNVTINTPPAFLVHAKDDKSVSIRNSLVMYDSLRAKNITAELKLYSEGGHGFGPGRKGTDSEYWLDDFKDWLLKMDYLQDH